MATGGVVTEDSITSNDNQITSDEIREIENNEPYTYESLRQTLEDIKQQNSKEIEDFENSMKNIYYLQNENVKEDSNIQLCDKFKEDLKETQKKFQNIINSKNNEIFQLSREIYRMKHEIKILKQSLPTNTESITKMNGENELVNLNKSLAETNLQLEAKNLILIKENQRLQSLLQTNPPIGKPTLEQLINQMESTHVKLMNQLTTHTTNSYLLNTRLKESVQSLDQIKIDVAKKNTKINKTSKTIKTIEKHISLDKKRLEELQNQLSAEDSSDTKPDLFLGEISKLLTNIETENTKKESLEEYMQMELSKIPELKQLQSIHEEDVVLKRSEIDYLSNLEKQLKMKASKIKEIGDFLKKQNYAFFDKSDMISLNGSNEIIY